MFRGIKFLKGFTLIEIIITIVLVGLVLIPLGIMSIEHMRGITYSRGLAVAEGLAKTEMAKINNLPYNDATLADGYDNTTSNYEGYPYDLRRTVNYVAGSNNNLKQVRVKVYPSGNTTNHLVNLVTYVSNVSFGAGSGGALVNIPRPGCFLSGTPILMTDGSQKPIEEIKVGDMVFSFDEETYELKPDKVSKIFTHPKEDIYLIINGHLKVTPIHLVLSQGKWVSIGSLEVGDKLTNAEGKDVPIESIILVKEAVDIYNFEVNPYHTYIAGGIVVHNAKPDLGE